MTALVSAAAARRDRVRDRAVAGGCKAVFVGLETISQSSLAAQGKGFNQVARYPPRCTNSLGMGLRFMRARCSGSMEMTPVVGEILGIVVVIWWSGRREASRVDLDQFALEEDSRRTSALYRPRNRRGPDRAWGVRLGARAVMISVGQLLPRPQ
jgi:hypothetical protein